MSRKFIITDRRCGLGDSLLNIAAAWYLGHCYNRDVIVDWRRLPYTLTSWDTYERHHINLFSSLFGCPAPLEGVKFFFPENFPEIALGPKASDGFPADLDHLPLLDQHERDLKKAENLLNGPLYIRTSMRMGQANRCFSRLRTVNCPNFNFWNFLVSLPIAGPVADRLDHFHPGKFSSNEGKKFPSADGSFTNPTVAVHFRHGNGEKIMGRGSNWIDSKKGTQIIREEAEKFLGKDLNKFNFFICSDSPSGEKFLKESLPNSFSFPKSLPAEGDSSIHFNTDLNPVASLQESFIDMMLMAKCSHIMYTQHSTFSMAARFNIPKANQRMLFKI